MCMGCAAGDTALIHKWIFWHYYMNFSNFHRMLTLRYFLIEINFTLEIFIKIKCFLRFCSWFLWNFYPLKILYVRNLISLQNIHGCSDDCRSVTSCRVLQCFSAQYTTTVISSPPVSYQVLPPQTVLLLLQTWRNAFLETGKSSE